MTIKQAQQELARPLVFGNSLQIKALEILRANDRVRGSLDEFDSHAILNYIGEDIVREWLDDKQPSSSS